MCSTGLQLLCVSIMQHAIISDLTCHWMICHLYFLRYGFEKPSAIQQRAVKPIMMGKDVIAQAQSGEER